MSHDSKLVKHKAHGPDPARRVIISGLLDDFY